MDKKTMKTLGVAALILLAPGGFLFGATLAAQAWRKRAAEKHEAE